MAIDILVLVVTRHDTYAGRCRRVDLAEIYENVYFVKKGSKLYEPYLNIPNLRNIRDCLLLGFEENILMRNLFFCTI